MSLLNQILSICAASLALGLGLLGVRGTPRPPPEPAGEAVCNAPSEGAKVADWVSLEEAHASFGDPQVLFVDCRSPRLYETGHIAGALSLPAEREEISAAWISLLREARTVITYCDAAGGCASSVRLAERLHAVGVADARILTGGLPGWLAQGYPAESGECPRCPEQSEP